VFQEADLSVRVVRDIFSAHFERAVVDDPKQHHRLVSFFTRTAPELVDRVELWQEDEPLFEAYGVEPVIDGMLNRRVDLPSGGYLMIDYAEALTVIDVNTGSFTGKGRSARLEDTITKTNLEAAEGVVNQLRLRDIGGIIVIDFIDMARARNRDAVLKVLRKALDEDRTKTFVVEISPLGLVEMTRQNVTDGVREIMSKTCPVCNGEGVVKSEETIAIETARHLRHLVKDEGEAAPDAYLVRMNPRVSSHFTADGARELHALEEQTGKYFHFEGSEGLPLDHFAVTMEGTRDEIEERAVPFRVGEEVHVEIVEPHMYNPDDGVAKVDGYLISVTDGIGFVGEKKLVRIEEAGRTAAVAALTGADADVATEAAKERAAERKRVAERARRSAAAKRGAAARKARDEEAAAAAKPKAKPAKRRAKAAGDREADKPAKPKRRRAAAEPAETEAKPRGRRRSRAKSAADSADLEADAARVLAEDDEGPAAGTAPAAVEEAEEAADTLDGDGDALSSRSRRRGRRGGRRRSRAKASADAEE
jgi:ribonuclease G